MKCLFSFLSRFLLGLTFFGVVLVKLISIQNDPSAYSQYIQLLGQLGLGENFAPLIFLIEFVGGLAIILGFKTRFFAYVLAVFSLFMAVVIGRFQPDPLFIYLGLCGAFLALANNPSTAYSLDNLKK